MLNYAETASSRTIVPVEVASEPSPDLSTTLSALLNHPEVVDGIQTAHYGYHEGLFEEEDLTPLTEATLITLVEKELSGKTHQCELRIAQHLGHPTLSYLHRLGFVLAWIDLALQEQQKGEQA